jgi:hypothetical protein
MYEKDKRYTKKDTKKGLLVLQTIYKQSQSFKIKTLLYQYLFAVADIQSGFQSVGCSRCLTHRASAHVVDVVSGILVVVGL